MRFTASHTGIKPMHRPPAVISQFIMSRRFTRKFVENSAIVPTESNQHSRQ
jgi:hypothetical protein